MDATDYHVQLFKILPFFNMFWTEWESVETDVFFPVCHIEDFFLPFLTMHEMGAGVVIMTD